VGIAEDIERIAALPEANTVARQEWLDEWGAALEGAVNQGDEELCEDLHVALIVWERTELRPSDRRTPVDEVIREFGFDPAELGIPT
jgi:hypothetical protein